MNIYSVSKSERALLDSKTFNLSSLPKEKRSGWNCQRSPSPEAISQGQEPDENVRQLVIVSDIELSVGICTEAENSSNEMNSQNVDSTEESRRHTDVRADGELEAGEEGELLAQPVQEQGQEVSEVTSRGYAHDIDPGREQQFSGHNSDTQSPMRRWYGPPGSSSESEEGAYGSSNENEEDNTDVEDSEEKDSHEDEDSDSDESTGVGAADCILRSPSETDSEDYHFPWRLRIRYPSSNPYRPRPVQDFGPGSTSKNEWLDLPRPPLGLQFWNSMTLNPKEVPGNTCSSRLIRDTGFYCGTNGG